MKLLLIVVLALLAGQISAQGSQTLNMVVTNFPLFGAAVTPTDDAILSPPRAIRADADGAVTARCAGNDSGDEITLEMVAGEFFPCQVVEVLDTGTDAITIHGFY